MKSYVVIGLGRFGTEVARSLCRQGCEVLALDAKPDLVQQISNDVTHAVTADARDKEVLRALGVKDFECAVVAIGDDLAAGGEAGGGHNAVDVAFGDVGEEEHGIG